MEENSVTRNGRLTIPLYHGTSTVFYDSIVASGLGGRNIVEDLDIRAAARRLVDLYKGFKQQHDWLFDVCVQIAGDPSTHMPRAKTKMSFRYGGTYLTPSRSTAISYATSYSYGSEALHCTWELLNRLSAICPELTASEEFSNINALVLRAGKPLVIDARDIEVRSLRSEHGSECTVCV